MTSESRLSRVHVNAANTLIGFPRQLFCAQIRIVNCDRGDACVEAVDVSVTGGPVLQVGPVAGQQVGVDAPGGHGAFPASLVAPPVGQRDRAGCHLVTELDPSLDRTVFGAYPGQLAVADTGGGVVRWVDA